MAMDKQTYADKFSGEAKLHYGLADFQILRHGSFVICAFTGKPIPLEELRYWNSERQEAYIDAEASTAREIELASVRPAPVQP